MKINKYLVRLNHFAGAREEPYFSYSSTKIVAAFTAADALTQLTVEFSGMFPHKPVVYAIEPYIGDDPHTFQGGADRDCEICGRPDRAEVHKGDTG